MRQEVQELRRLAVQAQAVEDAGTEAKLSELKALLQKEGFFDHADQRLLLFTEFKDTLDYLMARLKSCLGFPRRLHPRRHEVGLA